MRCSLVLGDSLLIGCDILIVLHLHHLQLLLGHEVAGLVLPNLLLCLLLELACFCLHLLKLYIEWKHMKSNYLHYYVQFICVICTILMCKYEHTQKMHTWTHVHTRIHAHTHPLTHTHTNTHTHTHIQTHTHTHTHTLDCGVGTSLPPGAAWIPPDTISVECFQ